MASTLDAQRGAEKQKRPLEKRAATLVSGIIYLSVFMQGGLAAFYAALLYR